MDIWQESHAINFSDIDRSDRLTLSSIFNYFQEAAINHAEALGVGRDSLEKTRQVWILSRISVHIERRPKYRENVVVRTWPRGGEKLFALRDYTICDAAGDPVVRGRSNWLIIDIDKRRPLRPLQVMENLPLNEGIDALPSGASSLEKRENLEKLRECRAAYSDLDYNGHVNNVRYIQWIQDSIQGELLENADRMRLDINYISEIKPGETTEIWRAPIAADNSENIPGSAFAFEGRKEEAAHSADAQSVNAQGAASFRAELRLWRD